MDKTHKIRKIGADKIALLGLFAVSLLIAHMIVISRSAIMLSKPIKLIRSGLSVSMPEGNGWKCDKTWRQNENGFFLRSRFALGTNQPTAEARCIYTLAAKTFKPHTLFVQKTDEVKGEIIKVDQISNNSLTFDWAYIKNTKVSLIFIFGTAKLPNNHRLDIEVREITNDPELAEQAFKKIVKNLKFEENPLIPTDSMPKLSRKPKAKVSTTFPTIPEI